MELGGFHVEAEQKITHQKQKGNNAHLRSRLPLPQVLSSEASIGLGVSGASAYWGDCVLRGPGSTWQGLVIRPGFVGYS